MDEEILIGSDKWDIQIPTDWKHYNLLNYQ